MVKWKVAVLDTRSDQILRITVQSVHLHRAVEDDYYAEKYACGKARHRVQSIFSFRQLEVETTPELVKVKCFLL